MWAGPRQRAPLRLGVRALPPFQTVAGGEGECQEQAHGPSHGAKVKKYKKISNVFFILI